MLYRKWCNFLVDCYNNYRNLKYIYNIKLKKRIYTS